MLKNNLTALLSKLSDSDFKKFGKFVSSPYFNSNKKVVELYGILKEFHPDFEALELSKEYIHRKLYKGDEVNYGTFYYLISEMESLLEKFIAIEKIDPLTLQMTLLRQLTVFGMHRLYDKKYKEVVKKLSSSDDNLNLNNFILAEINRDNSIQKKEMLTKKDLNKKEWTDPSRELLRLFIKNNLRNIVMLKNYNQIVNKELDILMLDETLKFIEKKKLFDDDPEVRILKAEVNLLMKNQDRYYNELKTILKHDRKGLSMTIIQEMCIVMNNYLGIKQLSTGTVDPNEFHFLSEIYLEKLGDNENEKISIDAFVQIFINASALSKFDWIRNFLDKYTPRLEEKYQNNALCYGNAFLYYESKEFEKALKEIAKIKSYSVFYYKAAVKILQLKIYYELKLYSEGLDIVKSFEQFLRNDKFFSFASKKSYSDFLRTYTKLVNAASKCSPKKISSLQSDIKSHKGYLIQHRWFERMLKELAAILNSRLRLGSKYS